MRGTSPLIPSLIVVILVTASMGAPMVGGQIMDRHYCPPGDQDHGPPDPPGDRADRDHIDLKPGTIDLRFPESGAVVEPRGGYLVSRASGNAELDIQVRNIGNQDAPATTMALTLHRPNGSTTTHTADVPAVTAGATIVVTVPLQLKNGHHELTVHVNPDQDPAESCQDARPNNECGSVTEGCAYTYYDNNKRTIGMITGNLPGLSVQSLSATPPERATHKAANASQAEIRLVVQNLGNTDAFHLGGTPDDAPPFTARLSVPGCACPPKDVDVANVPAGGTRTLSIDLPVHGLRNEYTVHVELDPYGETADLDRTRASGQGTFPLPTPNLIVQASSDHDTEGETLLVKQGDKLVFDAVVENIGDADARNHNGDGFRVIVERDRSGNIIAETTMVVRPGETGTLRVEQRPHELSDSHVYRITVDPDDEVLEKSKVGNLRFVPMTVARYGSEIQIDEDDRDPVVPPGVDAKVPFTLKNTGTITDTFHLKTGDPGPSTVGYQNMNGEPVEQVRVAPDQEIRLQFVHSIPKDAEKEESFTSHLQVESQATGDTHEQEIRFTVGPDTVPPTIRMEEPRHGFLGDDTILLEVTDNVQVTKVETDLFGSYQEVKPEEPGSSLYRLDATGTPDFFTLSVRATDSAGNEATREFSLTRDKNPPEIDRVRFNPSIGIRPGDRVSMIATIYDNNMDRLEIQITQPRPGDQMYMENITIREGGPNYILRDWRVPERPGHYVFKLTAIDQAGNQATSTHKLFVRGLNIEIVSIQPRVFPAEPEEGETVRLTYQIRNTSPDFETGGFFVSLVLDFRRQIGLERINLGPGEVRAVSFNWVAEAGPHAFTFIVDQAEEVAEDNDNEDDNLHFTETGILFPNQELFAPEILELRYADTFGELVQRHWWVSLMLVAVLSLFAAAFVLARRNGPT